MNSHVEQYTKAAEEFADSARLCFYWLVVSILGTPVSWGLAYWALASISSHPHGQSDAGTQLVGYLGLFLLIVPLGLWVGAGGEVLETFDERRKMKEALQKLENYEEFVNDLETLELQDEPV